MASGKSVWGIDIGQCALKALKLRETNGEVQAEAFDIIEHPRILSQPEADRNQLIRNALEQFQARNNVGNATLVVSVPGQSSFTRFIKLPPVDPKRIPEIVKFEAEQQIPFPINDVIWRYQTFLKENSPDVELGIFAMKKVDVAEALEHFEQVEMEVDVVQMAPLALCNYMSFDQQLSSEGATLLADVGVDKTDLVVADGSRIWMRTIQLGGSSFTEALVRAFKLPFNKAEKLKRSAASSKYARQIFQAMRPVFADLVQEIQRSIGFYTQLHRETRFKKLIGLGNGFRLPGLQKFLEQNLNVPVHRVDSFNNLSHSEAINAPAFTENVLSFAVAYGLAIQGMGHATVDTNLLPSEVTRKRLWAGKRPLFTGAAACLLAALGLYYYGQSRQVDRWSEASQRLGRAERVIRTERRRESEYDSYVLTDEETKAQASLKYHSHKSTIPQTSEFLSRAFERVASDQPLYNRVFRLRQRMAMLDPESQAYQRLQQREEQLVARLKSIPRRSRRLILLEYAETEFIPDVGEFDDKTLQNRLRQMTGKAVGDDEFAPGGPQGPPGGMDYDPEAYERRFRDEPEDQTDEKEAGDKGIVVLAVGRSPASEQLLLDMLRNIAANSAGLLSGGQEVALSSLAYEAFHFEIDPQGAVLQNLGRDREDRRRDEYMPPMPYEYGDRRSEREEGQIQLLDPDPLFSLKPEQGAEEGAKDLYFVAAWVLKITGDGIEIETPDQGQDDRFARR
jgi:type IV pilus assembly protein PilM